MTDRQFISYRRLELTQFENLLEIAARTHADSELVRKIENLVEMAKADIKA